MKKTLHILRSILFFGFSITGFVAVLMIALSFTSWPYHAYHWTNYFDKITEVPNPDLIILMGAGGFPGSESLLRCYYTAEAAHKFPVAKIIVAFPADTADFGNSDHYLMIEELKQRGIDSSRILSEVRGHNTYTQAVNIRKMFTTDHILLLVTSPVHTYRSIKTFEKQGFKNVYAQGTIEGYTDVDLFLSETDKQNKIKSPDANPGLRYNIWSFMQYEIAVLREWTAIGWYKLKGYL
ncbi:MAG: YdcF family protein [Bacteroidales bacterium]|jgi:uncharacterized SAM-binding protein YcdF (DUF218 family)|nr:YdcF family protein [Bacteroidales bacterium]